MKELLKNAILNDAENGLFNAVYARKHMSEGDGLWTMSFSDPRAGKRVLAKNVESAAITMFECCDDEVILDKLAGALAQMIENAWNEDDTIVEGWDREEYENTWFDYRDRYNDLDHDMRL